jgi:TIR domain
MFLRKAGVTESFITYTHALAQNPIGYYTCFISHSSKDQEFVESLHADLQAKGVRCWYAPEDMKTGDKIRQRIDESIRLYDKLLLVLSEQSVKSAWVEYEVEAALAKERRESRTVLFPIRLDTAVMESHTNWADHIRETRLIGDFTCWKGHDAYQRGLKKLLRDLQLTNPPTIKP